MALFKKKEVKTEEQRQKELKEVEPTIETLNIGKATKEEVEMTLDEVIAKNPTSWTHARILEQLNELNIALASLEQHTIELIEEIKKK